MKNFSYLFLFLSLISTFFACSKADTIEPQIEEPIPLILNSKWTFNGNQYAGGNPGWGIPCGSSKFMFAEGKAADTIVYCDLIIPGYLREGKFQMYTYAPSFEEGVILTFAKQLGSTTLERHTSIYGLNDSIDLRDNGEFYTAKCNNITLIENFNPNKRKLFSCEIKFKKPVIPAANTTYTMPVGIPENKIYVDNTLKLGAGATCLSYNITNYGGYFQSTYSGYFGGLKFHFSDAFPPTRTYDIISDFNLKPGKVFIEYEDPNPISFYKSTPGGTATVITTQNKFIISFNNTLFNNIGTTGNPSILVKANVGFY